MGLFYFALRQSELLLLPPIQELEMRKKRKERERKMEINKERKKKETV